MIKIFLLTSLFLFSQIFYAQEIKLTGVYNGTNLYVMNHGADFCVSSIYINDSLSKDEIKSNAFEINFDLMDIDSGAAVNVVISHKENCKPVVINPDAINPLNNFAFKSFRVNRNGTANFSISGDQGPEPIKLQQFRWGKWINIADVAEPEPQKPNYYNVELKFHFGENLFRLVRTSESGVDTYSKTVKIRSQNKELKLVSSKVSDILKFTDETFFEIFDERGGFIRDGYGLEEDVSDLSKGKYWVNYDNKTEMFNKR